MAPGPCREPEAGHEPGPPSVPERCREPEAGHEPGPPSVPERCREPEAGSQLDNQRHSGGECRVRAVMRAPHDTRPSGNPDCRVMAALGGTLGS